MKFRTAKIFQIMEQAADGKLALRGRPHNQAIVRIEFCLIEALAPKIQEFIRNAEKTVSRLESSRLRSLQVQMPRFARP